MTYKSQCKNEERKEPASYYAPTVAIGPKKEEEKRSESQKFPKKVKREEVETAASGSSARMTPEALNKMKKGQGK